jgi:hypothetical protein
MTGYRRQADHDPLPKEWRYRTVADEGAHPLGCVLAVAKIETPQQNA